MYNISLKRPRPKLVCIVRLLSCIRNALLAVVLSCRLDKGHSITTTLNRPSVPSEGMSFSSADNNDNPVVHSTESVCLDNFCYYVNGEERRH